MSNRLTEEELTRVRQVRWAATGANFDNFTATKSDVRLLALRLESMELADHASSEEMLRWLLERLKEDRKNQREWLADLVEQMRIAELLAMEADEAVKAVEAMIAGGIHIHGDEIIKRWDAVAEDFKRRGLIPADPEPPPEPAEAVARAKVRGFDIRVLEPPAYDDLPDLSTAEGPLYRMYWTLRTQVGINMAHGVLADVSAWLTWCEKKRAIRQNWAKLVDRETPPGRIRVGTWPELRAMIEAAEALGWHSIADSVVLGLDLSWSQADRLALTWPQISAEGRVRTKRIKTGISGEPMLLDGLGKPRIEAIRARQKALYGANVQPTHVLVCETTRRQWTARYYREIYALVRAHAAIKVPSVATLNDQDLRDTAITVAFAAGLKPVEIATRSLHSLKRINEVLEKHYAELNQEIADAGALKLNEYLARQGVKL